MKNLYLKIPQVIRNEIKSVLITFVSVFVLIFATQIAGKDVAFSADALAAICVAAFRAGIKAAATLVVTFLTPKQ